MGIFSNLFGGGKMVTPYTDTTGFIIIDVRTPAEYAETHVNGSLNIDFMNSDFKKNIEPLERHKKYKLYCRSGNRSGQAAMIMKRMGFTDVENIGSVEEASQILNTPCT